MQLIARAGCDY